MTRAAAEIEVAGWAEAVETYYERGWTDGLPVVPATPDSVCRFLEAAGRDPADVVLAEPTRRRTITAEKVAINAVLAGCRPEYMPVLTAALEAMADPAFTLHGAITSTGGSATLVVVNGPIRQRLGFNAGGNVFGPGWRANATIGRAIRLITLNCLGATPGLLDRSTQGHPGKYAYCIAELEEANPWEPLHVTRGCRPGSSAVTVFAAEGPHNVLSHYGETAEEIVVALADTMACLGASARASRSWSWRPSTWRSWRGTAGRSHNCGSRSTRAPGGRAPTSNAAASWPELSSPPTNRRGCIAGTAPRTSTSSWPGAAPAATRRSSRRGAAIATHWP